MRYTDIPHSIISISHIKTLILVQICLDNISYLNSRNRHINNYIDLL